MDPKERFSLLGYRLLPLLLLANLGGCIAIAAGAAATYGAVTYSNNEASQVYNAPFEDAWQATLDEMDAMGYPAEEGAKVHATEGKLKVRDLGVNVEKLSDEQTRVRARFGTFDSKDHRRKAKLLLEGVAKRLS